MKLPLFCKYCGAFIMGEHSCPEQTRDNYTPPIPAFEEIAQLRKDAKRYRWLRDHCTNEENPSHTWIVEAPGELWDDAIDAAMESRALFAASGLMD